MKKIVGLFSFLLSTQIFACEVVLPPDYQHYQLEFDTSVYTRKNCSFVNKELNEIFSKNIKNSGQNQIQKIVSNDEIVLSIQVQQIYFRSIHRGQILIQQM